MNLNSFIYTVIIPYGKKSGDITRCIKSILTQDILPKQIFIICNGEISKSSVKSIIEKFSINELNFVKFIYPEKCPNGNVARNIGLMLVDTEWVMFVDNDDWWCSNWINSINSISKNIYFDFLYSSIRVYSNNESFQEIKCEHFSKFKTPENYLLAYNAAQTSSYVIKTNLAKKIRWDENLNRHQDYDFFVRLVNSQNVISIAANSIYVNVDWSTPRRTKYSLDYLKVVKKWKKVVERKYYLRHIKNLTVGAIKSGDLFASIILLKELLTSTICYKNNNNFLK